MQSWSFPTFFAFVLALAACFYTVGWFRLRRISSRPLRIWDLAIFFIALILVWIVVGSPLAALDHELLVMHMVQHLLLMGVAAPLILLSEPGRSFFSALPKGVGTDTLAPFFQWARLHRASHPVSHLVLCWFAGTITVIAWHVPALFELGMHSHWWHEVQFASFLAAGLLFWWPVISLWRSPAQRPGWSVPLYLFLATLPCDALSAFLTFTGHVVYSSYRFTPHTLYLSPLQDQEWAGALMWVFVTFLYATPAVVTTVQILSPSLAPPAIAT